MGESDLLFADIVLDQTPLGGAGSKLTLRHSWRHGTPRAINFSFTTSGSGGTLSVQLVSDIDPVVFHVDATSSTAALAFTLNVPTESPGIIAVWIASTPDEGDSSLYIDGHFLLSLTLVALCSSCL